jgi:hypothetical protein
VVVRVGDNGERGVMGRNSVEGRRGWWVRRCREVGVGVMNVRIKNGQIRLSKAKDRRSHPKNGFVFHNILELLNCMIVSFPFLYCL